MPEEEDMVKHRLRPGETVAQQRERLNLKDDEAGRASKQRKPPKLRRD